MKEELKFTRALQNKIASYKGTPHYNNSKTAEVKRKRTLDLLSGTNPEVLTELGITGIPDSPYEAMNSVRSKDLKIVKNTEIFDLTGKGKLTGHHGTPASLLRALQVMDDDAREYVFKSLADLEIKHGMDPEGILALDSSKVHGKIAHGGDWTGKRTGAFLEPIPGESGPDFMKRLQGAYNIQMDMNERALADTLTQDWQGAMRGASEGLGISDLDLNSVTTPSDQRTAATKVLKPSAKQVREIVQANPGNPLAIQQQTSELIKNTPLTRRQQQQLLSIKDNMITSPSSMSNARRFGRAAKWIPAAGLIAGFGQAGHAVSQGDYAGAAAHGVGAVVGEIPVVGDVIVDSVAGTGLADGTLNTNLNRVPKQGPANTYAPTGDKTWDDSAQPFIQMLNGITPKPKKPDFKQTAISAFNTPR
jgi:hypothetical protein